MTAAHLASLMPESIAGEIASLWSEYEDQASADAADYVKASPGTQVTLSSLDTNAPRDAELLGLG